MWAMIEKLRMWFIETADRRGHNGEAAATQSHIAREAACEVIKKRHVEHRRAFQQNVWQLLVGLSL